jgi:hypothetical protein
MRHAAVVARQQAEVRVGVMDPFVPGSALASLGEDLFLLSTRRRDGKLLTRGRVDSGTVVARGASAPLSGRRAAGRVVRDGRLVTTVG